MSRILYGLIILMLITNSVNLAATEIEDISPNGYMAGNDIESLNVKSLMQKVGFYGGLGYGLSGETNRMARNDFLMNVGLRYSFAKYGVIGAEYMFRKATSSYGSSNIIGFYELPFNPVILQVGLGYISDTYFRYTNAYFGSYWREQQASGFGFRAGVGYEIHLLKKLSVRPMAVLNLGLEEYSTNYGLILNISRHK